MNALDKLFIWLKKRYPSDPTVKLATTELADLRARVEAVERVISEIEWNGMQFETDGSTFTACPCCHGKYPKHDNDCELAAALRGSE